MWFYYAGSAIKEKYIIHKVFYVVNKATICDYLVSRTMFDREIKI